MFSNLYNSAKRNSLDLIGTFSGVSDHQVPARPVPHQHHHQQYPSRHSAVSSESTDTGGYISRDNLISLFDLLDTVYHHQSSLHHKQRAPPPLATTSTTPRTATTNTLFDTFLEVLFVLLDLVRYPFYFFLAYCKFVLWKLFLRFGPYGAAYLGMISGGGNGTVTSLDNVDSSVGLCCAASASSSSSNNDHTRHHSSRQHNAHPHLHHYSAAPQHHHHNRHHLSQQAPQTYYQSQPSTRSVCSCCTSGECASQCVLTPTAARSRSNSMRSRRCSTSSSPRSPLNANCASFIHSDSLFSTTSAASSDLLSELRGQSSSILFLVKSLVLHFAELTRVAGLYRHVLQMRDRLRNLFRWRPTSTDELDQAEQRVLSYLKCDYKGYFVDIGKGWDLDHVLIWTLEIPPTSCLGLDNVLAHNAPQLSNGATNGSRPNFFRSNGSLMDSRRATAPPLSLTSVATSPPHQHGLPLVMIHGFASGVGLWSLNLDQFANEGNRSIFAFDLLGFAKSSRPKFTFPKYNGLTALQQSKAEAEVAEEYLVDSIEKWRQSIGPPLQNKFILLGHSFGAYLALAYALRYPDHIAHIVLADPWGLPPENHSRNVSSSHYSSARQLPFWLRCLSRLFFEVFTPLAGLRAVGPWGPTLVNTLRPDLKRKFERLTRTNEQSEQEHCEQSDGVSAADTSSESADSGAVVATTNVAKDCDFLNYIYHCNAQARPSGEIAFKKLCTSTGWARLPMLERIIELEPYITLSFIYGSRSWVDRQSGFQAKYILATAASSSAAAISAVNNSSDELETDDDVERVDVHVLQGAGHHVYADTPQEFNELVLRICAECDNQIEVRDRISNQMEPLGPSTLNGGGGGQSYRHEDQYEDYAGHHQATSPQHQLHPHYGFGRQSNQRAPSNTPSKPPKVNSSLVGLDLNGTNKSLSPLSSKSVSSASFNTSTSSAMSPSSTGSSPSSATTNNTSSSPSKQTSSSPQSSNTSVPSSSVLPSNTTTVSNGSPNVTVNGSNANGTKFVSTLLPKKGIPEE